MYRMHFWQFFFFALCFEYLIGIGCRFMKRNQLLLRTTVFGWGIKAGQAITTCTRNTVTPHWMELSIRCTLRWLLATGSGFLVSKSSRPPLSQLSFARGKVPSNSTIPRSSFHWFPGRSGHLPGSWRPHTRHQGPTCLFNFIMTHLMNKLKEGLELDMFLNLSGRELNSELLSFGDLILLDYDRTTNGQGASLFCFISKFSIKYCSFLRLNCTPLHVWFIFVFVLIVCVWYTALILILYQAVAFWTAKASRQWWRDISFSR